MTPKVITTAEINLIKLAISHINGVYSLEVSVANPAI